MSVAKRDLEDNRKVTTHRLIEMKQRGEKISMLTAYDYSMAQLIDQAGMDVILVGDSASNVMAGNVTTLPITLDQMIYHGKSVMKAVKRALVVVDLPFGTYQGNSKEALASAIRVMKETHADCIKLEGGSEIRESIERILCAGIPVMGHLGLTPQSINKFGTYTVRAREEAEAKKLIVRFYEVIHEAAKREDRQDVLILGCNCIGHLGAGLMQGNRTGDDTSGVEWERTRKMGINTLAFRMLQQGTFYGADADCVGITEHIDWNKNRQWMEVLAESGTPFFVSVKPGFLNESQKKELKEAYRKASQPHPAAVPLDWMETKTPEKWQTYAGRREYNF